MIELAILCIILIILVATLYLGFKFYTFMILGIAIGVIVSKKIEQLDQAKSQYGPYDKTTKLFLKILKIFFFTLITISTLLTYEYSSYIPPTKPIGYYIAMTIASGILWSSILIKNKIKSRKEKYYSELFQAFLLSTITYFSTQLIVYPYSGVGAMDTINNIFRISGDISVIQLINEGHIPRGIRYSHFPGHYLLTYIAPLVSNTNFELMYYYLGGFIGTLVILLVYITGNRILGRRDFAVITALITASGLDYYNYWISHPHQFTYAFPLAILSFVVLILYTLTKTLKYIVLLVIVYTMLVISHDYTTLIFTFGVILVCIFANIFNRYQGSRYHFSYFVLLLMVSIMFIQFMYNSQDLTTFTQAIREYLRNAFSSEFSSPGMYSKTSLRYILVNTISAAIILFLATPGVMHYFKKMPQWANKITYTSDKRLLLFIIFGGYYLSLIGAGIFLKAHYLMPQRIYVLLQIFSLVYLSGYVLRTLLSNSKKIVPAITIILIAFLFFFSQSTIIAGFESSPFLFNTPFVKTYYTPQEISSAIWISSYTTPNYTIYTSLTTTPQALLVKIGAQKFLINGNITTIPISFEDPFCYYNLKELTKNDDKTPQYLWLDKYDNITGIQPQYSGKFGTALRCHVKLSPEITIIPTGIIYSNKIATVMIRAQTQ